MNLGTLETPRYASLRKGGKGLGRLALWVQLGFLIMGMGLFLDQARDLLSDAQFTWGERRVMGVIALVTLGGCGLAGWIRDSSSDLRRCSTYWPTGRGRLVAAT